MKRLLYILSIMFVIILTGCYNLPTNSETTPTEDIDVTKPTEGVPETTPTVEDTKPSDEIEINKESIYYFRSNINNWNEINDYNLIIKDGIPTFEIELSLGDYFKIADINWNKVYEYGNEDANLFTTDSHLNYVCKYNGIYVFKIINYGLSNEYLDIKVTSDEIDDRPVETNPDEESPSDIYYLGDYGDYVYSLDNTIDARAEYLKLSKKVLGNQKGIFQTNYEQGLLDLFDINNEIKINIIISNSELRKLDYDNHTNNKETYRKCDLKIEVDGLIFYYKEVGIRQKGNTSRGNIFDGDNLRLRHYKLNFAETFDDEFTDNPKTWTDEAAKLYREDRDFFGLEKLDIRWNRNQDATYLKEYYAYEMYRASGVLAPRSNLMNVVMVLDGKELNMGVYLGVETIDKQFIKRNVVATSKDGDLYKLGWTNEPAKLNSTNDSLFGVETQYKNGDSFRQQMYVYDLKNNKKTSKHEALKNFINQINNTSTNGFKQMLETYTDFDSFIAYLSAQYLAGDVDDLRGNYNNTYIYFDPSTNKAYFIPTDNDRSFGSTGGGGNPTGDHNTLTKPFDKKTGYGGDNDMPLYQKSIYANSSIKQDYLDKIETIIDNGWLDIDTFTSFYKIAKQNYSDNLDLGYKFCENKIAFKIEENNNIHDGWNLSINVYFTTKKNTFLSFIGKETILPEVPDIEDEEEEKEDDSIVGGDVIETTGMPSKYYLYGSLNNWQANDSKYNLKIKDNKAVIELSLTTNIEFKIRHTDGSELIIKNVSDRTYCTGGGGDAIKVTSNGVYLIEVNMTNKTVTITKK